MPVSSAILSPKDKEVIIHDGYVHCEGYVLVSYSFGRLELNRFSAAGRTVVVGNGSKGLKSRLMAGSSGTKYA